MGHVPPEVEALVARSAAVPRGLAFLHRAPLDAVAAAFGATPAAVEAVRAALARSDDRAALLQRFTEALASSRAEAPQDPPSPPPPRDPQELIRAAERHPLGAAFLREAQLEVAAVAFAVHPELVSRARALLAAEHAAGRPWELPAAAASSPPRRRA